MEKDFFQQVFEIVRQVPLGKVTTYGAVAKCIGSPKSSRMVGWALNKSGLEKDYVPAHRVVNRNGLLSGKSFFAGENTMRELLESEGVKIVDDKVIDFEKHFWDPFEEY